MAVSKSSLVYAGIVDPFVCFINTGGRVCVCVGGGGGGFWRRLWGVKRECTSFYSRSFHGLVSVTSAFPTGDKSVDAWSTHTHTLPTVGNGVKVLEIVLSRLSCVHPYNNHSAVLGRWTENAKTALSQCAEPLLVTDRRREKKQKQKNLEKLTKLRRKDVSAKNSSISRLWLVESATTWRWRMWRRVWNAEFLTGKSISSRG